MKNEKRNKFIRFRNGSTKQHHEKCSLEQQVEKLKRIKDEEIRIAERDKQLKNMYHDYLSFGFKYVCEKYDYKKSRENLQIPLAYCLIWWYNIITYRGCVMNLSAFYDECQKLPDNKRQWVDVFYKTVLDVFGEDHQSFEERDKVCQLFYGNSSSLSKAQYYRKRNLVRKLYDWLAEQGAVSQDFLKEVYGLQLQDVVSNTELYHYYLKQQLEVLEII